MGLEDITSDYILNDGQVVSADIEFGEVPSATITLKARKRNRNKVIEERIVKLRLTHLTHVDIVDDFTSKYYSDITVTRLENGDYYVALDPYDNSNVPKEQDNFVFKGKILELREE